MKKLIFLAVILSLLFTFGCKTNDTGADNNEKMPLAKKQKLMKRLM